MSIRLCIVVQILLLKPYSFAELNTDENIENVSEKLEQLQEKFSVMKTNFQILESSNLKVKLEIHELNEKFQDILDNRILKFTKSINRQYKNMKKKLMKSQSDNEASVSIENREKTTSVKKENQPSFKELADKMKIIEEKTAELERNKSNTTFSLRNQLQTIQQKTAELDKSAKTINFEQNKNNLILINITTALNGVQESKNFKNNTQHSKDDDFEKKINETIKMYAQLKTQIQSASEEANETKSTLVAITKTFNQLNDITQQVNKNNKKLNNVMEKLQNEKNSFNNQSSIIISQIHNLNKKLVNGSDEKNNWQQLFIENNLSQLSNLDEKLYIITTTLNVETNKIRKKITEIKSLENYLYKATEKLLILKNKTEKRMLNINFKPKSIKNTTLQLVEIKKNLNALSNKLKEDKVHFLKKNKEVSAKTNKLKKLMHTLNTKIAYNKNKLLNLTSFFDSVKSTGSSVNTNRMSIKNIENHLTTFDEDNKIKLNELSGNISSISNAIHLLDERLNMLNEVLNETSQKNSDNEIKTVKFKADFNDVKNKSFIIQQHLTKLSSTFKQFKVCSNDSREQFNSEFENLKNNLTIYKKVFDNRQVFINKLFEHLYKKYEVQKNYTDDFESMKSLVNKKLKNSQLDLTRIDDDFSLNYKITKNKLKMLELEVYMLKKEKIPLLNKDLMVSTEKDWNKNMEIINQKFITNNKSITSRLNTMYKGIDKLKNNITEENKAFLEESKSYCVNKQKVNENQIDDLNKVVENIETNYLTSCDVEEIQYGSHNSTALLRNGEFVEYSCYRGYKFRGEVAVRRCSDGVIVPSFHEEPLSCDISMMFGPNEVSFDEGIEYCKGQNSVPMTKHMSTRKERQNICKHLGTQGVYRVGFIYTRGKWRNYLGEIIDAPVTNDDNKEGDTLSLLCVIGVLMEIDYNQEGYFYGEFVVFPKQETLQPLCMSE